MCGEREPEGAEQAQEGVDAAGKLRATDLKVKRSVADTLFDWQSEARKIVAEARALEIPSGETGATGDPLHHPCTVAYSLRSEPQSVVTSSTVIHTTSFTIPTAGGVVGTIADMSGAFDLLADASGALLRTGEVLVCPPEDSITIITYWWGYELACGPSVVKELGHAHFVSGFLLQFLQGFVLAGGACHTILRLGNGFDRLVANQTVL